MHGVCCVGEEYVVCVGGGGVCSVCVGGGRVSA